ncbi:GNAT family N-acetyltransferase [Nocardia rhizosphaerihabitans]|uniref:N-acetyltransferase n=1 Tax=Nocardia rhizosphaerihabitans TaxID=1691570 RepID=A0ABQ2KX35_9NOCA|nr:GNAT family protein [Nocardia rhizosphaerihabitans]GGN95278.1 N-acetyltransferase [Nocardia rhizosphaerihabitans]
MPAPVILHGRIVRLEPLAPHHVPGLVAAAAALGPAGFTIVPHGEQEARTYVFQAEAAQLAGTVLAFAIVTVDEECVVGATRFTRLDYWQGPLSWPLSAEPVTVLPGGAIPDAVEIGNTWLTPAVRGGLVNLEAKLLMLTHAFDGWGVRRVTLRADARNLRSRAAIERLGAVSDGVRRAHSRGLDGAVRDTAFYSILQDEWPGVRLRITEQLAARAAMPRAPLIPATAESLRPLASPIG